MVFQGCLKDGRGGVKWCQNGEMGEGPGKLSLMPERRGPQGWDMRQTLEVVVVFKNALPLPQILGKLELKICSDSILSPPGLEIAPHT